MLPFNYCTIINDDDDDDDDASEISDQTSNSVLMRGCPDISFNSLSSDTLCRNPAIDRAVSPRVRPSRTALKMKLYWS